MPKKKEPKFKVRQIVTGEAFTGEGEVMETVKNEDGSFQHRVRVDMVDGWVPEDNLTFERDPVEEESEAAEESEARRNAGVDERIVELTSQLAAAGETIGELKTKFTSAEDRIGELTSQLVSAEDRIAELNNKPPVPGK